jgi:hypothetical protein
MPPNASNPSRSDADENAKHPGQGARSVGGVDHLLIELIAVAIAPDQQTPTVPCVLTTPERCWRRSVYRGHVAIAGVIAAGMHVSARQLARRKERRREILDTRWRSPTTCVPSTTPLIPWPVMLMPKIVLPKLLNRIVASLRSRAARKRNKTKNRQTY